MAKQSLPNSISTNKLCSIEGCSGKFYSKKMCRAHYERVKNYGRIEKRENFACFVVGCKAKYAARGYCMKHLRRFDKYGDPLILKHNFGIGNTPEEKFWSRVNKTKGLGRDGDCWEWMAATHSFGHGSIRFKGKNTSTHIVAWFLTYGEYPIGVLRHTCDNPPCVNPAHLLEGTQLDNIQDRNERGRTAKGEAHGAVKLSEDNVRNIRLEYRPRLIGNKKQVEGSLVSLAKKYRVSRSTIWHIVTGRTWTHLD